MSSWTFAVVLPGNHDELDTVSGLRALRDMSMDPEAFVVRIDKEGLIRHGAPTQLSEPAFHSACEQIRDGTQLQVTCRNEDVYLTFMVARASGFEVLLLGWPRRTMEEAGGRGKDYDDLLLAVATECRPSLVLFVDDPPDGWLGQIVRVDGQYLVSPSMPNGFRIDYRHAWVRSRGDLPDGLHFDPVGQQLEGFVVFEVRDKL